MPGNLMYKYLPYALGRQKYVLELAAGICMLFAQRLLSAPPFVVSFPCKANKRKYEVTFTAIFEHNSCIIIVQKKKRNNLGIDFKIRGVLQSHLQNLYIDVYIGSLK